MLRDKLVIVYNLTSDGRMLYRHTSQRLKSAEYFTTHLILRFGTEGTVSNVTYAETNSP